MKIINYFSFLLVLVPELLFAQIKILSPETPKSEPVAAYDSLTNLNYYNAKQHVGQKILIVGSTYNIANGFHNVFFRTPDHYNFTTISFSEVGGKYFDIVDVFDNTYNGGYWVKLVNCETKDVLYLQLLYSDYESLPWITVGFYEKLQKRYMGKPFGFENDSFFSVICEKTNQQLKAPEGTNFKLIDIGVTLGKHSLAATLYNKSFGKVKTCINFYDNGGEFPPKVIGFYDGTRFNRLVKKYGLSNAKAMIKGYLKVGWTKAMLKESHGEPEKINYSRYGKISQEQWIYDKGHQYVYLRNGKITSWQNLHY